MIVKRKKDHIFSPYGKYFLANEAPGDEDENSSPGATEQEVAPNNLDNGEDFNADDMVDDNAQNQTDTTNTNDTETPANPPVDNEAGSEDNTLEPEEDFNADDENQDQVQPQQDTTDGEEIPDPDTNPPDQPEEPQQANGEVGTDQAGGDRVEVPADQNQGNEADNVSDDEDFNNDTDGTGDDNGQAQGNENQEQNNDEKNKTGAGLDFDSTRKYMLFKEYLSLYTVVNNYITRFENIISDEKELNQAFRTSTNILRDIHELLFDYMTMRFEASTYVQSLVFYQKIVIAIQICFKIIIDTQKRFPKKDKTGDQTIN